MGPPWKEGEIRLGVDKTLLKFSLILQFLSSLYLHPLSKYLLCILTSFWVLCTPKSWLKYFFWSFLDFFLLILSTYYLYLIFSHVVFFSLLVFYFLGVCCNIRSFSFPFIRSSGLNPDVRRPLFLKAPPLAV